MKIDLHLHSHVSDGDLSPTALANAAAAAGLDVIALTDHDTAAGVEEALAAARDLPLRVIPGIEISTSTGIHEFHVLGYWIDPRAASIVGHQAAAAVRRVERMERMVERMGALGVRVTMDDVRQAAGPDVRTLGRPHLARALLAGGYTRSFADAFNRYIGDRGPAFVAQDFPSPEAAIQAIHAGGGVAVWAHPPLELVGDLLPSFAAWGVDGVECYRPNVTAPEATRVRDLARSHGLFVTGGSDWHGPRRGFSVGEFVLVPEQIPEILAMGGLVRPPV